MGWIAALRTAQKNSRRGAFYMRPWLCAAMSNARGRIWNPPLRILFLSFIYYLLSLYQVR